MMLKSIANNLKFLRLATLLTLSVISCQAAAIDIQHWQTKNGAQVYFVASNELPMLDLSVVFPAGSARDAKSQYGLANFTNSMLGEATSEMNIDQISDGFTNVGAIFSHSTSRDSASLNLRSLTQSKLLTPALQTFNKVLSDAQFPQKNFSRVKAQLLQAVEAQAQNPISIANKTFFQTLYGSSPYGHSPLGSASSIQKISIENISKFYQQYYIANNAIIAIVGDLDKKQAEKIAESISSQLPAGKAAAKLASSPADPEQLIEHVNYPSSQTYVRIGELAIARDDPNYFPLLVGNYTLGGGMMVSRLHQVIREEKGLSYSIWSHFFPMKNQGPFIVSFQTRNDSAEKAIELTRQTLSRFVRQGVTAAEVKQAKTFLISNFPTKLSSNKDILANVVNIAFYQLPLDYLDTYTKNIGKVTHRQIDRAFQKYINPDELLIITVGPEQVSSDKSNLQMSAISPTQVKL